MDTTSIILMRRLFLTALLVAITLPQLVSAKETRCGWFDNPTPGNLSLIDRDGQWIIGTQGGHFIEDDWESPKFTDEQWIATNGHYGYGCACFDIEVDEKQMYVTKIYRTKAKPLAACRKEKGLKEPSAE